MRPRSSLYIVIVLSLVLMMGSIPLSETIAQTETPNGSLASGENIGNVPNNEINTVEGGPGFVSINGLAFEPEITSGIIGRLDTSIYNPGNDYANYLAPVDLPNGARVKKIVFYYLDIESSADALIDLTRVELQNGNRSLMASTISSSNPVWGWSQGEVYSHEVVDLQNYTYIIRAYFPGGLSTQIRLYSVRIDYEYPGYLPVVNK